MTWLEQFNRDLKADQTAGPRTVSLATVTPVGEPDVRTVVLRSVTAEGGLVFTSDARSEKNQQLRANPAAAGCVWLIDQRVQWRMHCRVRFEQDPTRQQTWQRLPDAARALFTWPAPGMAFEASATFNPAVPADAAIPASFEVLTLMPGWVERLDLRPHPHERLRWQSLSAGSIRLNP